MLKITAIIATVTVFYNISFAISVNEIVPIHVSSEAIDAMLGEISYSIEPYAADWTSDWKHPVSRKEVEEKIISAINELNSRVWAQDLWTIYFIEALLWHYFYQLENEKGYFAADSICKIMQKEFPQKYESFWLDGVNKIKAGRVGEGFAVLDSLYMNAPVSSSFLNEYSLLSKKCFIPKNYEISKNFDRKRNEFYFSPKEMKPVLSFWETEESNGIVSFVFTERYSFVENFQIKYPRLYNDEEYKPDLKIDKKFLEDVKFPVLWEPGRAALHPAAYKITVDRSRQTLSLFEYLLSIVYNRFDFIAEIKPPLHEKGISVRAGEYNAIRGVSAKSIIYTLYDSRNFGNTELFYTTKNTLKGVKAITSRILVSLETTQRAEPKAIDFYIDIINGNFTLW
jgi:hypothetical protein